MNNTTNEANSIKTITIDPRFKEVYYQAEPAMKESIDSLKHKQVFWNYMMNVSMQNAIIQMSKTA